jgi:hypothetical protein
MRARTNHLLSFDRLRIQMRLRKAFERTPVGQKEFVKKSSSAFIATAAREDKTIQDWSSVNLPWAGSRVR